VNTPTSHPDSEKGGERRREEKRGGKRGRRTEAAMRGWVMPGVVKQVWIV